MDYCDDTYEHGIIETFIEEKVIINKKQYMDFSIHKVSGFRKINKVKHAHHKLELSLVKSGTGKYYIGDECYDVKKDDIFIINNIEDHGIELGENESITNMVIHFEPRFVWSDRDEFDSRYLKIFFDRSENFSHKLDRDNSATQKIRDLFLELEEEFTLKLPEYNLMAKVKLLNILVLLLRHYGYIEEEVSKHEKKREIKIINEVTDYIDWHYDQEIKLKELADIAHMNPAYFSTFFKKYNGISPIDYIIRERVTRAIDYLKNTDKTILEISGLCGFNNSTNFNKMFKKITGLTPSAFRE